MSAIEINVFGLDGACRPYGEVRNAMDGALTIWERLSDKYRLPFHPWKTEDGFPIWKACNQGKLSEADRICVLFTFDNAWVRREHVAKLVEALRAFHAGHVAGTGITPSIAAVADALEAAAKDETILGFSFNQTSVNSNPWFSYSDGADEPTPYNVLTGTRHWEIFDDWKPQPAPSAAVPAPPA